MVRTSGIREKLRSNVLKDLAKERGTKRSRTEKNIEESQREDEDDDDEDQNNRVKKAMTGKESLLSILPKPKNSTFGPTVKLDKLLKMPERAEAHTLIVNDDQRTDVARSAIKNLTVEKTEPVVIVPKGKEKQKNQITYLAQLGKATELERKEQAAQGRMNKAASRSKYGW